MNTEMKNTVYTVISKSSPYGDDFHSTHSTLEKANKAARTAWDYLTEREQKESHVYVTQIDENYDEYGVEGAWDSDILKIKQEDLSWSTEDAFSEIYNIGQWKFKVTRNPDGVRPIATVYLLVEDEEPDQISYFEYYDDDEISSDASDWEEYFSQVWDEIFEWVQKYA